MMRSKVQGVLGTIYDRLKQSGLAYWCFPKSVRQDAAMLGKEERTYYVQKLTYAGGLLLFAVLLLGYCLAQIVCGSNVPVESITRPEAYEETLEIVVQAGEQNHTYPLEIAPVALSKEHADELILEVTGLLDTYILGSNQSLGQVTENLILPEEIPGYPFQIYWESDKEHLVDTAGTVSRVELAEDEVVILTAVLRYGEWIWEEQFGIVLCKEVLSAEEEYERHLGYLLKNSEKDQRNKAAWEVPKFFEGENLDISIVEKDYTVLILAILVLAAAAAVWIGQDYDLHASREKRKEVFAQEYMSFVESLSLYISAGLTLQAAMLQCAGDYAKNKEKGNLLGSVLSEFQRDLQNGCGFLQALEQLAAKADDSNYKRLAGILGQGMMNGSRGLPEVLEQEVEKVREAKRRQSKVKGEQVSTSLIAPMMLQLGIIIALIMIPAFTSMQF